MCQKIWFCFCISLIGACWFAGKGRAEEIPVELPDGFAIRKLAGDALVPDASCLGLDPQGHPIVAGPGYLKRLRRAEGGDSWVAEELAAFQGIAQGICFDSGRLWLTVDGAILRSLPRIDPGKPFEFEKICPITTGKEHGAHAVRRGPDGWMYVLCGNHTDIRNEFHRLKTSPIKKPRAGFLMRFRPDVTPENFAAEVVCHGFRNAYDFDFDKQGRIHVYDSDGERDVSLPWYRPTRLFQVQPGDDAGWMSVSWKRPTSFFDMPKLIGAFGRGSPTGVELYDHGAFGGAWQQAMFVGDWTFGRIGVARFDRSSGRYGDVETFAQPVEHFGFAITDLEVTPRGTLLVTTGGRGTEGALFEIYQTDANIRDRMQSGDDPATRLARELRCSLKSYDRQFVNELLEAGQAAADAEVVTEVLIALARQSADSDLLGADVSRQLSGLLNKSLRAYAGDRQVLNAARFLVRSLCSEDLTIVREDLERQCLARVLPPARTATGLESQIRNIGQEFAVASKADARLDLLRRLQLAVGGCIDGGSSVFASSTAASNLELTEEGEKVLGQILVQALDDRPLWEQAARVAGMYRYPGNEIAKKLVEKLELIDDPVRKIHLLIAIARVSGQRDESMRKVLASNLLKLRESIQAKGLPIDRNWNPRMRELVRSLFRDPELVEEVVGSEFGRPSQVWMFDALPNAFREQAAASVMDRMLEDRSSVTAEQLRCTIYHRNYLNIVRSFSGDVRFTDMVVLAVGAVPVAGDRDVLCRGLRSLNPKVAKQSAIGLRKLSLQTPKESEYESVMSKLEMAGFSDAEVSVKDQLVRLLRQWTDREHGYQFKAYGDDPDVKSQQRRVIAKWRAWLASEGLVQKSSPAKPSAVLDRLAKVDFSSGDSVRGQVVFEARQCAKCHLAGGRNAGPRLEGLASRFSREDVFRSIVYPHANVPDRYRAITVLTDEGQTYRGSVVYESTDGIMLALSSGEIVRVDDENIEERVSSTKSLMPEGLLDGISDQEIADLWSFLSR